jgi:hypothetical protein
MPESRSAEISRKTSCACVLLLTVIAMAVSGLAPTPAEASPDKTDATDMVQVPSFIRYPKNLSIGFAVRALRKRGLDPIAIPGADPPKAGLELEVSNVSPPLPRLPRGSRIVVWHYTDRTPVDLRLVRDLSGGDVEVVKANLSQLGLRVEAYQGPSAPTPEQVNTVSLLLNCGRSSMRGPIDPNLLPLVRTDHSFLTKPTEFDYFVPRGTRAVLVYYGPYVPKVGGADVELVEVPYLIRYTRTFSIDWAMRKLRKIGLEPVAIPGMAPRKPDEKLKVYTTHPARQKVPRGSRILVWHHTDETLVDSNAAVQKAKGDFHTAKARLAGFPLRVVETYRGVASPTPADVDQVYEVRLFGSPTVAPPPDPELFKRHSRLGLDTSALYAPTVFDRYMLPNARAVLLYYGPFKSEEKEPEEEAVTPSETATSSQGVDWQPEVPQARIDECIAYGERLQKVCTDSDKHWSAEDCRRSNRQSGCAKWKVGCFTPYIPIVFLNEMRCSVPGFFECIRGPLATYTQCVTGCNSQQDRLTCARACWNTMKAADKACGEKAQAAAEAKYGGERAASEPDGVSPDFGDAPAEGLATAGSTTGGSSRIKAVDSGARIRTSKTEGWKPLEPGRALRSGDEVETRDKSLTLDLGEGEGGSIRLSPGTRVKIEPRKGLLELLTGAIRVRIRRLFGGEAEFHTPTLIAGVRGTEFTLEHLPGGSSGGARDLVLVREGRVVARGRVEGEATLGAGQQAEFLDGRLQTVGALDDQRWARSMGGEPASVEPREVAPESASTRCQGILGTWRWLSGAMVECFPDGRCVANNGFSGPWKCIDPTGRFEIHWARPGQQVPYVDTLTLAPDGWELEGVNQSGQGVGGRRPEFTGGEPQSGCGGLVGKWRWAGGAAVECRTDGTCTASSGVSGPWRCINESGRFEIRWGRQGRPDLFIDNVVISPLGSYLSGKNQHGVATGASRE